jgi:hypothetical protein
MKPTLTSTSYQLTLTTVAIAVSLLAGLGLVTWGMSPYAYLLQHDNIAVRGWPDGLFVLGWLLMCVAMMLPTALPLLAAIERVGLFGGLAGIGSFSAGGRSCDSHLSPSVALVSRRSQPRWGDCCQYRWNLSTVADRSTMRHCLSVAAGIYRPRVDGITKCRVTSGADGVGVWLILFWLLLAVDGGDVCVGDEQSRLDVSFYLGDDAAKTRSLWAIGDYCQWRDAIDCSRDFVTGKRIAASDGS